MKRTVSLVLAIMLAVCLFPLTGHQTAYAAETAVVNNPNPADRLHLRAAPYSSATSYGRYYSGVVVTILEYTSSEWTKVRIGSGNGSATGYMMTRYLAFGSAGNSVRSAIPTLYVNSSSINLRATASASSASLGTYKSGTAVEMLAYGSTWYHVRVNGKYGYMQASLLSSVQSGSSSGGSSGSIVPGTVGYINNGNGKRLHLRAGAGTGYASLGLYYTGCPVTVLSSPANGWVKVRIGNANQGSQTGYMMTEYLAFGNVSSSVKNALPYYINHSSASELFDKPYLSENDRANAQYQGWYKNIGFRTDLDVLGVLNNGWLHVRIRLDEPGMWLDEPTVALAGTTGFYYAPLMTYK